MNEEEIKVVKEGNYLPIFVVMIRCGKCRVEMGAITFLKEEDMKPLTTSPAHMPLCKHCFDGMQRIVTDFGMPFRDQFGKFHNMEQTKS